MNASDLSIDSLSQLVAKLESDLMMARRVLDMVREQQAGGAAPARPAPAPGAGVVQVSMFAEPAVPAKSKMESIREVLLALPGETFRPDVLRIALRKVGMEPDHSGMRLMLAGLVKKAVIEVAEQGRGRHGSLYRRLISAPVGLVPPLAPSIIPPG